MRYLPWGETRYEGGNTPTNYHYTGQREEAGIGLYYYNARWYDAKLGRFAQADTEIQGLKEEKGKIPFYVIAWDRYNYANNNPQKYIDPTGHFIVPLIIIGIIGAGILFSQIPSDQYQPNPENWGDPAVAAFGFALLAAPVLGEILCGNDFDCLNEAKAFKDTVEKVGVKGGNLTTAESVLDKLNRYLLNPDHIEGGSKAEIIRKALGFTRENMDLLAKQIIINAKTAIYDGTNQWGDLYIQVINIIGANGREIAVRFVWILNHDGVVRLVTAKPVN